MTDKPSPSLNLIERMAQRLAKQEDAASKLGVNGTQASATVADSAPRTEPLMAQRLAKQEDASSNKLGLNGSQASAPAADTAPRTEPHFVPSEPASQPNTTDLQRVAAPISAPEPVRRAPEGEKSREIHLDFRVLRQNGMITPDNMGSLISYEFRGIKRKILQTARDPETRAAVNNLLMVTSSLPGEGKTFTSFNLAISLAAERGLHVLLIDGDVVRPSLGDMFKSPPRDGLTDLLSGKVSRVTDVMCRCAEVPNLAVMFSGPVHADSPELISSGRMADLCKELSKRYPDRMIIIDTPPVLASPEPASLAAYVDQLIMVVAADQTDRHQLRKSLEAVSSCKNISLLFNKAPKWNEAQYTPYYGYAQSATPAAAS